MKAYPLILPTSYKPFSEITYITNIYQQLVIYYWLMVYDLYQMYVITNWLMVYDLYQM